MSALALARIEEAPAAGTATRFGIVVPMGGAYHGWRWSLESLARQTAPLQVSLMDASGDPTVAALADEYAHLFAHRFAGPDGGQTRAIQTGWAALDADVYGWLNVDDILMPNALEEAGRIFDAEPDADVVFGGSLLLDQHMAVTGVHPAVAPVSALLRRHCMISQPSCFVRRRMLDKVGGLDFSFDYAMDWDLWVRLYEAGARFRFVDAQWSMVTFKSDTKTASISPARLRELFRLIGNDGTVAGAARSTVGFALNHMRTYTALAPVADAMISGWRAARGRRAAPAMNGFDVDNRVAARAELPMTHYEAEPLDTLEVSVHGACRIRVLDPDGADRVAEHRTEGDVRVLRLDRPARAGEVARLVIEAERRQRFGSARWRGIRI
jgi:hypothetical protein